MRIKVKQIITTPLEVGQRSHASLLARSGGIRQAEVLAEAPSLILGSLSPPNCNDSDSDQYVGPRTFNVIQSAAGEQITANCESYQKKEYLNSLKVGLGAKDSPAQ
jgi:hypothetical protein